MHSYFIKEININTIKNSTIEKLKDHFKFKTTKENIFYTGEGFYIVNNDNIQQYKIIHHSSNKIDNYLNQLTLYINNYSLIKKEASRVATKFINLQLKKLIFFSKSDLSMTLEFLNDKLVKLYFTSKENIYEKNNFFFNDDISLYLKWLNI